MRVSVIVCTRNRADSIGEALAAITALDYPDFELLVVDSSTGEDARKTAALVAQVGAKLVLEPRSGLSIARNTGLAHASGQLIAFTDDDCVPATDWLIVIARVLANPAVWCCTGRVVQHNREGACDLFEEVAGQDLGRTGRKFTRQDLQFGVGFLLGNLGKLFAKHMKSSAPMPWCIGHGSSTAFRREAFAQLGGFDERFGGGAPLKSCDDTEMFVRILKSGREIVYEPAALVRHKHGFEQRDVFKTRATYSFGNAAFLREYRRDPLMFFQLYGRLVQLLIKFTQYRLLRNAPLAESFRSDLRGYLDGWAAHRQYSREHPGYNAPRIAGL